LVFLGLLAIDMYSTSMIPEKKQVVMHLSLYSILDKGQKEEKIQRNVSTSSPDSLDIDGRAGE
jgi:hypothetical protein